MVTRPPLATHHAWRKKSLKEFPASSSTKTENRADKTRLVAKYSNGWHLVDISKPINRKRTVRWCVHESLWLHAWSVFTVREVKAYTVFFRCPRVTQFPSTGLRQGRTCLRRIYQLTGEYTFSSEGELLHNRFFLLFQWRLLQRAHSGDASRSVARTLVTAKEWFSPAPPASICFREFSQSRQDVWRKTGLRLVFDFRTLARRCPVSIENSTGRFSKRVKEGSASEQRSQLDGDRKTEYPNNTPPSSFSIMQETAYRLIRRWEKTGRSHIRPSLFLQPIIHGGQPTETKRLDTLVCHKRLRNVRKNTGDQHRRRVAPASHTSPLGHDLLPCPMAMQNSAYTHFLVRQTFLSTEQTTQKKGWICSKRVVKAPVPTNTCTRRPENHTVDLLTQHAAFLSPAVRAANTASSATCVAHHSKGSSHLLQVPLTVAGTNDLRPSLRRLPARHRHAPPVCEPRPYRPLPPRSGQVLPMTCLQQRNDPPQSGQMPSKFDERNVQALLQTARFSKASAWSTSWGGSHSASPESGKPRCLQVHRTLKMEPTHGAGSGNKLWTRSNVHSVVFHHPFLDLVFAKVHRFEPVTFNNAKSLAHKISQPNELSLPIRPWEPSGDHMTESMWISHMTSACKRSACWSCWCLGRCKRSTPWHVGQRAWIWAICNEAIKFIQKPQRKQSTPFG